MTATPRPKWFVPVAILALLWNLLGCLAFLADLMLTPADVAALSAEQQAMYAARPVWALLATGVAVLGGAAGCVALIARSRLAVLLLWASLAGVVVQDIGLFLLSGLAPVVAAAVLQGLVLVIAIALVALARKALARGWIG